MNEKIEALKSSFDSELKKIANMVDLEALRVNYLGRKGKVTDALKGMGSLTDEQKKDRRARDERAENRHHRRLGGKAGGAQGAGIAARNQRPARI